MPVELEAKIKVDSHQHVRARLAEVGARRLGWALETNHIFDNRERSLLNSGCGLRVRRCQDEHGRTIAGTMTFKGPLQSGPLKSREEIEFGLDDVDAAIALLGALGFAEVVSFQKRRESWQLDNCRVELDEVPHLGCYVEIEGDDEPAIRKAQDSLGLGADLVIRSSYIALLVTHCREHNLPTTGITFPVS